MLEWTEAELNDLVSQFGSGGALPSRSFVMAIADRALVLAAARGGTLGPEALNNALSAVEHAKFPENRSGAAERLRQHVVAQGARVAALESHLTAIRFTRWKCEHGHPIDLRVIVEACKPESAKEISEEERKKMALAWLDSLP